MFYSRASKTIRSGCGNQYTHLYLLELVLISVPNITELGPVVIDIAAGNVKVRHSIRVVVVPAGGRTVNG